MHGSDELQAAEKRESKTGKGLGSYRIMAQRFTECRPEDLLRPAELKGENLPQATGQALSSAKGCPLLWALSPVDFNVCLTCALRAIPVLSATLTASVL